MSTSFTPGPYRAGRYSSMLGCPVMAQPNSGDNSVVICSVYGGLSDDQDTLRAECEATATLFSAAPDMRDALSDANAAIAAAMSLVDAEWRNHDAAQSRHDAVVRAFREKVSAALAKAEASA